MRPPRRPRWPKGAKLIQVEINADRTGMTKSMTVGIQGDARIVADGFLAQLTPGAGEPVRVSRDPMAKGTRRPGPPGSPRGTTSTRWGTSWNLRSRAA